MKFSQVVKMQELPALTGIRAALIITVMLYHAGIDLPAGICVTAFFVLSGFLITTLLVRELDRTGEINLIDFYRRRALRIFPAYYAFLALSIGADLVLGNDEIRPAIFPSLFYYVNYFNAFNGHPNISVSHAWSLAVEEQFYVLWPLLMVGICKWRRAALPWVLVGLIIAVMLWRSYAWGAIGVSYAYNAFDTRFDSIAVGCLLAVMAARLDGIAAMVSKLWLMPVVLIGVWATNLGEVRYTFGFTLCSILLAVAMVQLMMLRPRWLDWAPVKYIGSMSYGIYLFHTFALSAGAKVLRHDVYGITLGVIFALLIAACSYHFMEQPILRLGNRKRSTSHAVKHAIERASPLN